MSRIPGYGLHTLPVGASSEDGIQLAYYDTGAPAQNAYKTLVIMHGLNYSSPIFERLLPLASQHNIRLVLVDRRGYGQSSQVSEEEVRRYIGEGATEESLCQFVKARGVEAARFICRYAQSAGVPEHSITLLGWSAGNRNLLGLLAALDELSQEELKMLETYLVGMILWEPPYHIYSFDPPAVTYNPLLDKSIPEEDKHRTIVTWLSGYFKHGEGFADDYSKLEMKTPRTHPVPTQDNFTAEEAERILDFRAANSYELTLLDKGAAMRPYSSLLTAAYSPKSGALKLHNLKTVAIYATSTLWEVIVGPVELKKYTDKVKAAGGTARPVDLIALEGNHFLHWDDPEPCMKAFVEAM